MCFKLIKKRNNINSLSLHQLPDASINSVSVGKRSYKKKMNMTKMSGAPYRSSVPTVPLCPLFLCDSSVFLCAHCSSVPPTRYMND